MPEDKTKINQKIPKELKKRKSGQRIKRKSSERKTSVKKIWEKFVQQNDSRLLLKEAWKVQKDYQKEYSEKINKLHKKYCS
jgi:hypothetical protein